MIEINNLSFSYGKLKIFENFNLHIPEGQVCLITGINGVGKSTLLRLMAGVLKPVKGEILFDEKLGKETRWKIGFISDMLSLYESLTVAQSIDFHKSVYGLRSFDDSLIRHTKIIHGQRIKELSSGQKTIFHLSLILSIEPEVLLIDEIIHSIDAYLRRIFLEQLIQLQSRSSIVIGPVGIGAVFWLFYSISQCMNFIFWRPEAVNSIQPNFPAQLISAALLLIPLGVAFWITFKNMDVKPFKLQIKLYLFLTL